MVALESTVIAHGLPHPRNLEVASRLESLVRAEGAVPATIGLVAGVLRVGLDGSALERFATASGVLKASARDLGPARAAGADAATTVAATAAMAHAAGIEVFATGGIGGVHRGGERSMDVSADLVSLSRTPVAVVCAGAKAILDLDRTLEVLETFGVPVVGLRTREFPAFYSRRSGLPLEHSFDDEATVARAFAAHRELGFRSAMIVCNPPPAEHEMAELEVRALIARAERDAHRAGISGKALTPWLLDRLAVLSEGRTVRTNVALLESNARVAARVARAVAGA